MGASFVLDAGWLLRLTQVIDYYEEDPTHMDRALKVRLRLALFQSHCDRQPPHARLRRMERLGDVLTCTVRLCALSSQYTWTAAGALTLMFCIGWPVLTLPAGVFSLSYFYFFVVLSILWGFVRAAPLLLHSPCMRACVWAFCTLPQTRCLCRPAQHAPPASCTPAAQERASDRQHGAEQGACSGAAARRWWPASASCCRCGSRATCSRASSALGGPRTRRCPPPPTPRSSSRARGWTMTTRAGACTPPMATRPSCEGVTQPLSPEEQ